MRILRVYGSIGLPRLLNSTTYQSVVNGPATSEQTTFLLALPGPDSLFYAAYSSQWKFSCYSQLIPESSFKFRRTESKRGDTKTSFSRINLTKDTEKLRLLSTYLWLEG